MSTISSADGHCQQRKLKEQWEKSRERAIFAMLLAFAQTGSESEEKGEWAGSWDLNLMLSEWEDHWETRSLARHPPLLIYFSLLTVTISRWNCRHSVPNRFVVSVVSVPCPNFLIRKEFRIVRHTGEKTINKFFIQQFYYQLPMWTFCIACLIYVIFNNINNI